MKDDDPEITPHLLLRAYASGVFPMAESADARDLLGRSAPSRHPASRRAARAAQPAPRLPARRLRDPGQRRFTAVLDACADRPETWINGDIRRLYRALHRMGHAHSVEVWIDDRLAGGLYGVALGAAFFGESMFSHSRDASKFALIALAARLNAGGFRLLDTQFVTDHLARLGAIEISRASYRARLQEAINRPADFFALAPDTPAQRLLQLSTQTS
jgi:leucyl/phenylalanyl-tRNA---protein transferase